MAHESCLSSFDLDEVQVPCTLAMYIRLDVEAGLIHYLKKSAMHIIS